MTTLAERTTERVARVRERLQARDLDAQLVRSTDRYLNEYVPRAESTREWLTGFTGSMGEAVLTQGEAWLCVDGRYYLQADEETAGTPFAVDKVPLGTSLKAALFQRARRLVEGGARRVGYEPDRFGAAELEELRQVLAGLPVELVPTAPSPLEEARGEVAETYAPVRALAAEAVGLSVVDKLARLRPALEAKGAAAFLVQRLDELAWLTNLRGQDLPFQATFRGVGLLFPERVVVSTVTERVPSGARVPGLELVGPAGWTAALPRGAKVGYDPHGATAWALDAIRAAGAEPLAMPSPVEPLKARKNEAELAAMRRAFALADGVVERAVAFVQEAVDAGRRVTEKELALEVERLFLASGATGLSFRVIAAAGANGAHIHYGHPDPERAIQPGELVLLDTGGYYAEGYATDLTRTFLAGSAARPTPEQQRIFTLVLKASIAGMSARFPVGTRGEQLDALVRAPIWAEGLDFNHGTGHGVGINVHESPPRVSTRGSLAIEPGHVFSIEPGIYLPGFGGVRIENLCTVEPAADAPGFLDVVPLTSAAIDERLIDRARLTPCEESWLTRWDALRQARRAGA